MGGKTGVKGALTRAYTIDRVKARGAFAGGKKRKKKRRCDIQIFLDIGGRATCNLLRQLHADYRSFRPNSAFRRRGFHVGEKNTLSVVDFDCEFSTSFLARCRYSYVSNCFIPILHFQFR